MLGVFELESVGFLGFDPIPVMHSTKCNPFTCKLVDGIPVTGVSGVEVLVS